jgi:hypothetical protein
MLRTLTAGRTAQAPAADAVRAAGLRYAPGTAASDEAAVAAAIAGARPEARRLVDLVDGRIDVRIDHAAGGAVGTTHRLGDRYALVLDLGLAARQHGQRGIARLVLHELGHVVDDALLTDGLRRELDARIPQGWGCDDGVTGACSAPGERFAETFAKWATNDIGVDLYLGYKVPPPSSLDAWGAPLAQLRR